MGTLRIDAEGLPLRLPIFKPRTEQCTRSSRYFKLRQNAKQAAYAKVRKASRDAVGFHDYKASDSDGD